MYLSIPVIIIIIMLIMVSYARPSKRAMEEAKGARNNAFIVEATKEIEQHIEEIKKKMSTEELAKLELEIEELEADAKRRLEGAFPCGYGNCVGTVIYLKCDTCGREYIDPEYYQ